MCCVATLLNILSRAFCIVMNCEPTRVFFGEFTQNKLCSDLNDPTYAIENYFCVV